MRISDWSSDVCSSDLHLQNKGLCIADHVFVKEQCRVRVGRLARHCDAIRARNDGINGKPIDGCPLALGLEIGRESCRARGCQYVSFSAVAVSIKKNVKYCRAH